MAQVMPLESLLVNPNPAVTRSKSILARFSNPLAKRSAKIFDFDIEPEHPHKTYRPGDVVKGSIVLSVFKGFDITHLVICLHGYARVFKHQCNPGDATKSTPESLINGKGTRDFEYLGNGLASLFQDEQILCGSGFLRKQVYKFGFELRFPQYSLPSTLEFERGAVNYMISATVTRPVAISPTMNKIYKVKFEDRIDIESTYTPKSRAIYLEPLTRRGKVKKVKQTSSVNTSVPDSAASNILTRQNTTNSRSTRSSPPIQKPPLSPAPSEDTVETRESTSTRSFRIVEQLPSSHRKKSDNSEPRSSTTSTSAHTISATTEISRHGALPGDTVPVSVKIEHTKAVRGIVIATLYRQGRIDMLPALPVVTRRKDKKPEYEDVYPKSRTGLGGLYFTNGTPNMVFRKDLTQTSTMMIVNPQSKTADVKFSVKVPDEAFPTMDNIPGGMISFTYHIEVVIDLTGKLSETRLLPSLTNNGPSFTKSAEAPPNQLTTDWASNILDTAPLRRTKNVASFELPLIIGTEDSNRNRKPQEIQSDRGGGRTNGKQPAPRGGGGEGHEQHWHENDYEGYDQYYGYEEYDGYEDVWYDQYNQPYDPNWHGQYQSGYLHSGVNGHPQSPTNTHYQVPPPDVEEEVDEKTRVRRHEELLLPSQPPSAGGHPHRHQRFAPSAPAMDAVSPQRPYSPQSSIPITISRASARSADTVIADPLTPPPSLPEDEGPRATEDKQELERRRLLAQASAPPSDNDERAGPSSSRHATSAAPSAPVIDEEEEYLSQTLQQEGNEALPQYRR